MDYSQFGGYIVDAATTRHGRAPQRAGSGRCHARLVAQLSIATYNVENLAPTDSADEVPAPGRGVVTNLASPDIVAVEEVQDNSGATDNGVVAADQTLTKLTGASPRPAARRTRWREIDPVNDKDGGQPGGNIRVVFLFDREPGLVRGRRRRRGVNRSTTGTSVVKTGAVPA